MISRTFIGLDLRANELRAVALRRKGRGTLLQGARVVAPRDGILAISGREANILDRRRFIETVHDLLDPLAGREERIALSLPDGTGRILLTEVETTFKSQAEGVEILKWHLKKSLPADPREIQLDYQVLDKNDSGRYRVVVSVMVQKILHQYEEAFLEAGYAPAVVDFYSMNLHNFYRPRLDLGADYVLVGVEGEVLSIQVVQGRILTFSRVADVALDPARVFYEINRSLVGLRGAQPGLRRTAVFLHSDWDDPSPLKDAVGLAFDCDVVLLDPHLERLTAAPLNFSPSRARALLAAVGAAERMM